MSKILRNQEVGMEELVEELARRVARTSQAAIARKIKVKPPLISNVLRGATNPCGKLLKFLGYERVIVYRRIV